MNQVKLPFYARLALILLSIVLMLFMLIMGRELFIPLIFALFISILLFPLSKLIEYRLRLGRAPAAIISVLLFMAFIAAFIYFLTLQIAHFAEDLPILQERIQTLIANTRAWIARDYHINNYQQTSYLNKSADGIVANVAHSIGNTFLSFTAITIWTIFVFIFTYFMLNHRALLLRFVLHLFNPYHRERVHEVVTETRTMINSYILGLLIEMLIISIINCTVFAIMGIKYGLLLGVMTAVLNIIPYLGIYTGMAISMLVTLANTNFHHALGVGIAIIIIHFVDANILMPRIVGARVKMNPLITIIAVLLGHYAWGIPGMFLFIPLTGIFKIVAERVEGLQPWAILIGTEEGRSRKPKKKFPGESGQ